MSLTIAGIISIISISIFVFLVIFYMARMLFSILKKGEKKEESSNKSLIHSIIIFGILSIFSIIAVLRAIFDPIFTSQR